MGALFSQVRRVTRFALAAALWLHTIFVFRVPPPNLSGLAALLHLTTNESVIIILLLAFSVIASYGYGRLAIDVLYIYSFPFIPMYIVLKWAVRGVIAVNRVCAAGTAVEHKLATIPTAKVINSEGPKPVADADRPLTWLAIRSALIRPLRSFTLLWCFLLLFTTKRRLLEVSLTIVLVHVVFKLIAILKLTLFSSSVITRLDSRISEITESLLAKIASVNRETEPTDDLRNIWVRISGIKTGILLLRNKQLVSRWAVVLGCTFLGCIYLYVAFLLSFVYYGVAHVQSLALPWPNCLVTSIFIPVAFSDLPANVWLKLIAGIHCTVILAVGAGTVVNYVTRKADDLQRAALALNERFADEDVQGRLLILEEKFKTPASSVTKT